MEELTTTITVNTGVKYSKNRFLCSNIQTLILRTANVTSIPQLFRFKFSFIRLLSSELHSVAHLHSTLYFSLTDIMRDY